MTGADLATIEILSDTIELVSKYEGRLRVDLHDPVSAVILASLGRQRRIAEALTGIHPTHSLEAVALIRPMLETWANVRWICIRSSRRRANRFVKFQSVEKVRALERISADARNSEWIASHTHWNTLRRRVRHLFLKKRGKKLRWDRNYSGKNTYELIKEIVEESGVPESQAYDYYRFFSGFIHGSVMFYGQVAPRHHRGFEYKPPPQPGMNVVAQYATSILIDVALLAADRVDPLYREEFQALAERRKRIEGSVS